MRVYLIRRLLLTIPTLFIASIIVFLSVRFIPGDVVDVMMMRSQTGMSEETRAAIRRDPGLDTPIHIQHGRSLKNSLIPVVSLVGLQLPLLFGGTVVIEEIFLLPGVGRYTVEATISRDYPVISGVLLLFGATVVLANLPIDLSYGFLDPRIRYE